MAADVVLSTGLLPALGGETLRAGSGTDRGLLREANEDSCGVYIRTSDQDPFPVEAVLVAADGVGGHEGGAVASRFVVDSVIDTVGSHSAIDQPSVWFARLLESVHQELLREAKERGMQGSMGSTATVAAIDGKTLYLAHVGDSRAYRLRNGYLEQLTDDDSWVARQERAGIEVGPDDPQKNVLTQCLGIGASLDVHSYRLELSAGDRYLLCSDGLHGVVDDWSIKELLLDSRSPDAASSALIDAANNGGGPDNITAVVFDVGDVPVRAPHPSSATMAGGAPAALATKDASMGSWMVGAGLVVMVVATLAGLSAGPGSSTPAPSTNDALSQPVPDSASGLSTQEQHDVGSRQDSTHPEPGARQDSANGSGPDNEPASGRPDAEDNRHESTPADRGNRMAGR